jgi:hypothetical protein
MRPSPKSLVRAIVSLLLVVVVARGSAAQPVPPFVFHNNFWINLHQFFHVEAGRRPGGADRPGG